MDRALKERIIGAAVLVVIVVLVVPVFLDGPADDAAVITEPVTLPGQNEQKRKQQTIVLERDRDRPVPASREERAAPQPEPRRQQEPPDAGGAVARSDAGREPPPEKPAAQPPARLPEPAPEEAPAAAAVASQDAPARDGRSTVAAASAEATAERSETGMWAVQLGSFSDKANAERLAASLRKEGYAAFLSRLQSESALLHRVRVGPQKDRDSAESIARQLMKGGHKGQVVPHP